MRRKLTILLFSLLLAVGWTSSVFAQSATYKASDLVGKTYQWTDTFGVNHPSEPYVVYNQEEQLYEAPAVTNAYQIYGMLRSIYMDKSFPGPYKSAYSKTGVREDDIFYGGCHNGWNIPGTSSGASAIGSVNIKVEQSGSSYYVYYVYIDSITVYYSSKVLARWTKSMGSTLPSTMTISSGSASYSSTYGLYFTGSSGTITLSSSIFANYPSAQVMIHARLESNSYPGTITVGNIYDNVTSTTYDNFLWNINGGIETFASDTYKPNEEGYTAIVVALRNTPYIAPEPSYYVGSTGYADVDADSVINYIRKNIQYVKLLTDGLRITDAGGNPGTVFNCDGTYNKFFFLGKGKARQKGQEVLDKIVAGGNSWPVYSGECVIFWPLFEEFSPTTAKLGDEITDFYSKMMEGNVYDVVHDCAGVIQNRHEFSMSGENGEKAYPFTGLNFFIPDYRLKYWVGKDSLQAGGPYYDIDGRDMNAMYKADGSSLRSVSYYYSNYAQYNPDYAPKIGIYKITLEAVATQVGNSQEPGNQNYVVTLTWVSSLNQMAGHDVPQTYTVYYYDPETGERKYVVAEGITDGQTGLTTVSYPAEQFATSYVIDHIVMGQPNDNDHPSFVAWSNHSSVVIPGWNDFVSLVLDHHESDFVISENSRDNWYRNFLAVINEDKFNGLTLDQVSNGMNTFSLYRQEYNKETETWSGNVKIATITFDQVENDRVHYRITYEPGQEILDDPDEPNKYTREVMDVPDQGWIRVKGNGDLVIWPNGYFVNFKSIVIKNGNQTLYNWNASSANVDTDDPNLPNGWEMSPGSKMMPYITSTTGDKVCYVEGGGYLFIPGLLNDYSNLTVEIVAYTDGANVGRIEVNDKSQSITNTAATYTWRSNDETNPISPNAAPRHDNNESKPVVNNKTKSSPFRKVNTNNSNNR